MKNKKKVIITVIAVVVIAMLGAVISSCFGLAYAFENGNTVTDIRLKEKNDGKAELRIDYLLPTGKYSVREVPETEGAYTGDGMGDYDGSLGRYRILVAFGDVEPGSFWKRERDENGILHLTDELRASIAHPSDHGFVLYIGSDKPMSVDTVELGQLSPIGGTIRIPITFG